ATVAIMGEVRRRDGTRLAVFSDERIGGGWGNVAALDNAKLRVGNSLADMITHDAYRGGRPGSPGFIARKAPEESTGPTRTSTDRLRDLEAAKEQNLLSDEEYREKRKAILGDF